MTNEARIKWMDYARTIAILLVVLNHAVEITYKLNMDAWATDSQITNMIKTTLFSIGRMGVPLFLGLTGALILQKPIKTTEDVFAFWRKNLLPLLLTIEIWNVLYLVLRYIWEHVFEWDIFVKTIFFLVQCPMANMWYAPMIIGMYIALPFVVIVLHNLTDRILIIPMCLTLIASVILPSVNVVLTFAGKNALGLILDLSFLGGVYGLYIICGYLINKGALRKLKTRILILGIIGALALTVCVQFLSYKNGIAYNTWYNFIGTFAGGLGLFELIRRADTLSLPCWIRQLSCCLSKISFAIFFMHLPMLHVANRFLMSKIEISRAITVILLWLISTIGSVAIILLLSLIKPLRKPLLFMK